MLCPRTKKPLKPIKVGGIDVQISEHCGGVFFNQFAIEKFKSPDEKRGKALRTHLKKFAQQLANEDQRINCPQCPDVVMMRRYYSPLKIIEIDECPSCAGIWLDAGELSSLQNIKLSESELAHLRLQMLDKTSPIIEPPQYKQNNNDQSNSLDSIYSIISDIFF